MDALNSAKFRILLGAAVLAGMASWFLGNGGGNGGVNQIERGTSTMSWMKSGEARFRGICDGSAGVLLDRQTVLVAYDENNTLFAFDTNGGREIARFDLERLLDLPSDREMDIEAAVRDDNQIWWIGSHGLNKKGKDRPNRRVLFSTNIPSRTLENLKIVRPPVDLTGALLSFPAMAEILTPETRSLPPKQGGIAIEGLAKHPDGGLMVGFRSPLDGPGGQTGKALVAHIVRTDNRFVVRQIYRLELGDRGIRDMISTDGGFLLIAGSAGRGGGSQLYNWQLTSGALSQVSRTFEKLNPEALVQLGRRLLVLSDDGKRKRPDADASDGSRKCDKIRSKSGASHPGVYFDAVILESKKQ